MREKGRNEKEGRNEAGGIECQFKIREVRADIQVASLKMNKNSEKTLIINSKKFGGPKFLFIAMNMSVMI